MSNIDTQIKELQYKKKKIDYIKYIEDLIKNDTKCMDFKEVKPGLIGQIIPVLYKLVQSIESDLEFKVSEIKSEFTQEQHLALIELSNRYILTKSQPKEQAPISTPDQKPPYSPEPIGTSAPKKEELSSSDKMNFAMNNRHLANQRVQVMNDQNVQIVGIVVGLDAPNVVVRTETGPTIYVPLEKVSKI